MIVGRMRLEEYKLGRKGRWRIEEMCLERGEGIEDDWTRKSIV
jgi:hypothetical protein